LVDVIVCRKGDSRGRTSKNETGRLKAFGTIQKTALETTPWSPAKQENPEKKKPSGKNRGVPPLPDLGTKKTFQKPPVFLNLLPGTRLQKREKNLGSKKLTEEKEAPAQEKPETLGKKP